MQGYQQRITPGLPGCQPFSCREAAYGFFDCVQLTDTFQGFFRCRSGIQVKLLWSTGDGLCLLHIIVV